MRPSSSSGEITTLRAELLRVKRQREVGRQRFTENQAIFAQRQHFCLKGMEHLQQPKVSISPLYIRAMQDLSCLDDSSYVIAREAELCRALHQVEVNTKQLALVVKHHKNMVETLKTILDHETKRSEDNEDCLLRTIKFLSIDMAGIIIEYKAMLDKQNQHTSHLKGEISNTGDVLEISSIVDDSKWSFSRLLSTRSDPARVKKRFDRDTRRMTMEKRITEVGSYLGLDQTAKAAQFHDQRIFLRRLRRCI